MKIEFHSISFRNFLTFGNQTQKFELKSGLNLITGLDQSTGRSNGAGKSSLLESICFALYGRTNRSIIKEKIVNWKNRKNCEVEAQFSIGANHYKIRRGIKPDFLEIYKNNKLIPQLPDVRQYQKLLENEILHIDFHIFISLVHINLNNYVPFLQMDTPKKRNFIEKMFGLEMFSDLNKLTNEKLVLMDTQLTQHNTELTIKSKIKNDTIQKIQALKIQLKDLKSSKSELDKVIEKLSKIEDPKEIINSVSVSASKLESEKNEIDQVITKLSTTLDFLNKEKENLISVISKKEKDIEQYKSSKLEYTKIIKENKGIEKLVKKEQEIIDANNNLISELTEKLSNAKVSFTQANTNCNHYKSNLNTLSNKTECPVCGTKVDKKTILSNIQNNIDDWQKQVDKCQKEIEKISDDISKCEKTNANKKLDVLIEKQKKYDEALLKFENIKAFVESIDISSEKSKLSEVKENIKITNKEYEENLSNSNKIKKEIEKISKLLDDYNKKIKAYNSLMNEKKLLEEKLVWEDKTKFNIQKQIETMNKEVSDIEKECKKTESSIEKLSTLKDYVVYIKSLCKDEGVKQYAISSILPYLTKRINEYLSKAGMSYFINFNNLLEDDIKGPGIYGASYGNLSGGESKSVDLAILFALLDISRLQFGVYPDILLMDEILDSSIDSKGLDSLLKIIWIRQMEDNSKVFLVTHRNDWDSIQNMKVYSVEKNKGFSTFKEIND